MHHGGHKHRRLAASALGRSLLGGGLAAGAPPLLAAHLPGDSQGAGSLGEGGGRRVAREARPRRAKSARLAAQVVNAHHSCGDVLQASGFSNVLLSPLHFS